jgi:ribonucleotide monophosphatase NagD (HAD superfamily)
MAGARLIATNDDPTFPTPTGPVPGAGAIVAAITTATGQDAEIAGKPYAASVALAKLRLDGVDVVVGDRPSTDGALARGIGCDFALVLSGVTRPEHGPLEPEPDSEDADLAALVHRVLA